MGRSFYWCFSENTKKKGAILDNTSCKLHENMKDSYSGIFLSYISDHLPHSTCLDIISKAKKKKIYTMKNKKDDASIKSFYEEVESSLRNIQFPNELTTDPNITYNLLEHVILSAWEKIPKTS